jgi:hypothetical protein
MNCVAYYDAVAADGDKAWAKVLREVSGQFDGKDAERTSDAASETSHNG